MVVSFNMKNKSVSNGKVSLELQAMPRLNSLGVLLTNMLFNYQTTRLSLRQKSAKLTVIKQGISPLSDHNLIKSNMNF